MITNIIQTYICKRILSSVFLTAIISSALFLVISVILWSPGMVENGWSEQAIFLKVLYVVPWFLGNIYPAVTGVGTLIAFSFLAQHNEIVALQSFGLSKIDFIKIIFPVGFILAFFGFFLISFLAPQAYKLSQKIVQQSVVFHPVWFKENNNIIYVKKMQGKKLYDISIFDLTNVGIKKYYTAKNAITGSASALYNVLIKHYENTIVTEKHEDKLAWPSLFPDTNLLRLLSLSQRRLDLFQLYHVIKIQKKMGLNVKSYQLRFWRMVLLPFFSLMLMFAIIPFAFQDQRSKGLVNTAILGLAISIIFYFFNQIAWSLVVILNLPIFFGALIAPMFVISFCWVNLRSYIFKLLRVFEI